jgi:hypothetical protein
MGTRSVRLDEETEKTLARLARMTGLTISEILKQGVSSLEQQARRSNFRKPWDVFRQLDLGPGGYAVADARAAKAAVVDAIRRKHDR